MLVWTRELRKIHYLTKHVLQKSNPPLLASERNSERNRLELGLFQDRVIVGVEISRVSYWKQSFMSCYRVEITTCKRLEKKK